MNSRFCTALQSKSWENYAPNTGVSWHSPYKKKDVAPDPTKSSIFSTMSKDKRPLKESYNCPLKKVPPLLHVAVRGRGPSGAAS